MALKLPTTGRRGPLWVLLPFLVIAGCGGQPQHLTQIRLGLGGPSTAGIARSGLKRPGQEPAILVLGARRFITSTVADGTDLIAANSAGRVLWRQHVDGTQTGELGGAGNLIWLPQREGSTAHLIAIDPASGERLWRAKLPAPAITTAWLAPYVVVQAGEHLLLLHKAGGARDAMWRVGGLVGVGASSWLWFHDKGKLSGIDLSRVRCAKAGCSPTRQWTTPFAQRPEVVSGALCGMSLPRVRSCVDGRTGKRHWLDYGALVPTLSPGRAGLMAHGHDGWGRPYVARLSPADLGLRWRVRTRATVRRISHDAGIITAWADNSLTVARSKDGRVLGHMPAPTRYIRTAAASQGALTWIFGAGLSASVGHEQLGMQASPPPRPPSASPSWLRAGVVLHYVDVRFERRDVRTGGLVGAQAPRQVRVRIEKLGKNVTLRISSPGSKSRRVTVSRETPTGLSALLPEPATATTAKGASPIHVGLANLQSTQAGAHISLLAEDPGVTFAGFALHRIGYIGRGRQQPIPRDLRAMRLRSVAGPTTGAHHYLVAPWSTLPVVLRVDGAQRLLLLTAVVANTP